MCSIEMGEIMRQKRRVIATFGVCLTLFAGACGADPSINTSSDRGLQQEASAEIPEEQNDKEAGKADSGNIDTGDTTGTDTSADEDTLYWQEVLDSFAYSSYDLTAALTEPALKDLCSDFFTLGVGLNGSSLENQTLNMPEYMAVAKKHFNSCTMTNLMKSAYLLDQDASIQSAAGGDGSPVLTFAAIDPALEWCMQNDMKMRGHTLVWHTQTPDWFFRENYDSNADYTDKETMLFRMESYIAQLMTHVQDNYPGVVYCWDVVNEAVDPDKGDRSSAFLCRTENAGTPNPWYLTIGEDYVEMAFTYARKYAADDVKLFYNDFNTYQTEKRDAIYTLCSSLKEKGLIDGIGMQGYWGVDSPTTGILELTIKKFAELELEIQITELSVSVTEEDDASFKKQGDRYGQIFMALKALDTAGGGKADITNVTFFGLIDHYRPGDTTNSRLFDGGFQPKPAFESVRNIMKTLYHAKEESDMTLNQDKIAEAIRQETENVAPETTQEPVTGQEQNLREPTAEISEIIPSKYLAYQFTEAGTIESVSYTSYDYFGDGAPVTKEANVYLPYGYSSDRKYNVLYLMHGIGGDENEWGMTGNASEVKRMMDNLIYNGDIEPFIVVTPNGRSSSNHAASGSDFNSFYVFGQELRNDLIPFIEKTYSTYAEYDENGYDLSATREHRAMAGLSMGGMQTINIGIGECVDLFGYFGAFSAAPTSNTAEKTAELLKDNTNEIYYFYNICGLQDDIAYASASAAAKNLPAVCPQFDSGKNFMWQELKGGHDFKIWYLGFYNFAQLTFR